MWHLIFRKLLRNYFKYESNQRHTVLIFEMRVRVVALLLTCWPALGHGDLFTDDGVLTGKGGPVRTISGFWTLVVTVHPPVKPDLTEWSLQLLRTINGNFTRHFAKSDQVFWKSRIHALQNQELLEVSLTFPSSTERSRTKRGLLNVFGKLGQSLFGTAMNSDVVALQHAVAETQEQMTSLYHNENGLLSVLNQTRRYMQENRDDIATLERDMGNMMTVIRSNINVTNTLIRHMTTAHLMRKIESNLQQMEMVRDDYLRKESIYHRQRMQLERGWLTEDILPLSMLEDILHQIQLQHHQVLSCPWYYEHIHIKAIWRKSNELAFTAKYPSLPIIISCIII